MELSTTNNQAQSLREEGHMASQFESEVREFAAEFPTPNVQLAVELCESGRLSWAEVHGIFRASLAQGLAEVAS